MPGHLPRPDLLAIQARIAALRLVSRKAVHEARHLAHLRRAAVSGDPAARVELERLGVLAPPLPAPP